MTLPLSPRRRRAWALAASAVALAAGGIVLLRAPDPAGALPAPPSASTQAPPTQAPPTQAPPAATASGPARVELDGPRVDGLFAFTEGAVLEGGARSVYAQLRLVGGAGGVVERAPVALAVVLDHSGSMTGDKIAQARESVVQLLERMRDDDRLAVVVYDHDALVLQSLAPVRDLRATLPARVRAIRAEGGTNIPAGLDLGASALASAPPGFVRRLVLVSDGQDGSGEALPSIAARVSTRAADRLTTSSLGIGVDYDELFLTSVADAGRGNYQFLAQAAQLDPFLRSELEQAASTVADGVVADVELPEGTTLVRAHGVVASVDGRRVRLPIGTLFAGERRKVVLELATTAGPAGTGASVAVSLRWTTVEDRAAHAIGGAIATVRAVATAAEVDASRDSELHADALATAIDAQQIEAMTAWRAGRREDAVRITDGHLAALRRAQTVAPTARVAAQIDALEEDRASFDAASPADEAGRAWGLGRGATRRARAVAF